MFVLFIIEIWSRIYGEFWNWIASSEQVNIVVGPAYDMNQDGIKDSYYQQAERWLSNSLVLGLVTFKLKSILMFMKQATLEDFIQTDFKFKISSMCNTFK